MNSWVAFLIGTLFGGSIAVIALGLLIGGHDDRY